jgi:hypothetical protein
MHPLISHKVTSLLIPRLFCFTAGKERNLSSAEMFKKEQKGKDNMAAALQVIVYRILVIYIYIYIYHSFDIK